VKLILVLLVTFAGGPRTCSGSKVHLWAGPARACCGGVPSLGPGLPWTVGPMRKKAWGLSMSSYALQCGTREKRILRHLLAVPKSSVEIKPVFFVGVRTRKKMPRMEGEPYVSFLWM